MPPNSPEGLNTDPWLRDSLAVAVTSGVRFILGMVICITFFPPYINR